MRTPSEIRASGRSLQLVASSVVILLALAALAVPSAAGTWLDATSTAALLACAGGLMAVTIGAPRLASALAVSPSPVGLFRLISIAGSEKVARSKPSAHPGC